jgi:hypothetical protein
VVISVSVLGRYDWWQRESSGGDEVKLEWAYPEYRIAAFWREACGWAGVLRAGVRRKDHVRYSAPWSEVLIDCAVQTGDQPFDDGKPASRSNLFRS